MNTLEFLRTVMVPDCHHYVWTLRDRASLWSDDPATLAAHAAACAPDTDVYLGLGGTVAPGAATSRAMASQVAGIAGVWADVDVLGDGHVGKRYPPTFDDAIGLIMEPDPSIVVHSGGGWQVYWLFREPWLFDDDGERQQAAQLLQRWQRMLLYRARDRGWVIDATHDLARVFRVPGTLNHKRDIKRPVEVRRESAVRYNPSDLIEILDSLSIPLEAPATTGQGWRDVKITVDQSGRVDPATIAALCENDDGFRKLWYHERPDLAAQSQSEYDLAMASLLVRAGVPDQQITDILIANRRKWEGERKNKPPDYYRRTLATAHRSAPQAPMVAAMAAIGQPQAAQRGEESNGAPGASAPSAEDPLGPEARQVALDTLSKALGLRIVRIVKSTGEEPTYRIILEQTEIYIPSVRCLCEHQALRWKIAGATDILIRRYKAERWDTYAQLLLKVAQPEIEGESHQERIKRYLAQYLGGVSVYADYTEATEARQWHAPHLAQGKIWVHAETITRWLSSADRERVKPDELRQLLASIGSYSEERKPRGRRTTYRFWALPPELFEPDYYRPRAAAVAQEAAEARVQ